MLRATPMSWKAAEGGKQPLDPAFCLSPGGGGEGIPAMLSIQKSPRHENDTILRPIA